MMLFLKSKALDLFGSLGLMGASAMPISPSLLMVDLGARLSHPVASNRCSSFLFLFILVANCVSHLMDHRLSKGLITAQPIGNSNFVLGHL